MDLKGNRERERERGLVIVISRPHVKKKNPGVERAINGDEMETHLFAT